MNIGIKRDSFTKLQVEFCRENPNFSFQAAVFLEVVYLLPLADWLACGGVIYSGFSCRLAAEQISSW